MHTAGFIFVLLFCLPSLFAQQRCTVTPNDPPADRVSILQRQLLKDRVDEMSTDVSAPVRKHISEFKDALAELVDSQMSCLPRDAGADVIQKELAELLPKTRETASAAVPSSAHEVWDGVYGTDLNVSVSTPPNFPDTRAVEIRFGISCGYDSVLLLYQRTLQRWKLALRWQSKEYGQISDAFGDFFVYTLLPSSTSPWRVAVAHGHP
jgi:hypothetical protein